MKRKRKTARRRRAIKPEIIPASDPIVLRWNKPDDSPVDGDATEDPAPAFERATAAAHEPESEREPEPEEQPKLTPDALVVLVQMLYSVGTEMTATSLGLTGDPEWRKRIDTLGTISTAEQGLLSAFAPYAVTNLAKFEAFMQRFGGIAFGGVVALGILSRVQVLKRWVAEEKAREERHRPYTAPRPASSSDDGSAIPGSESPGT